jgi:hypothetical protein
MWTFLTETKRIYIVLEITQSLQEENKIKNETISRTRMKQKHDFLFGILPHLFILAFYHISSYPYLLNNCILDNELWLESIPQII